jgi:hypothetical protein
VLLALPSELALTPPEKVVLREHLHVAMDIGVTWIDVAQVGAAVGAIARRPKLSIEEELDRANSLVETSDLGGMPHVRILVRNAKRRRPAQGTRVLIEGYTARGSDLPGFRTLGHQSLDWPSNGEAATTGAVTVFAGGARPITLGYFIRVRINPATGGFLRPPATDVHGRPVRVDPHYARDEDYAPDATPAAGWYLRLALAFGHDIFSERDKLPPVEDGYTIRLLVGADDGAARAYEIDINGTEIPIYVLPKYSKCVEPSLCAPRSSVILCQLCADREFGAR